MVRPVKETVMTPHASTTFGIWFTAWCWKLRTTAKMNHATPDAAQPEWMPPMCCRNAVSPIRNESGVHWEQTRYSAIARQIGRWGLNG